MWYEYLYRVLSIINYVVLIVIAIPIVIQVLYILLGFLPKKRFPKSEKKGRIAYLIPAHNEAGVIYGTVKAALENQNYPKELYDVYVVAHNCTDDTAELARKAGAKVLVLNDPDPAHRMALYPMKHGVDHIIGLEGQSLMDYATDPLVSIVICLLIIVGGLGFFVWGDIYDCRFNPKKFQFYTRMALIGTAILLVGGTFLFLLFERNNPYYEGYNFGERLLCSFFNATTARTAGYFTTPPESLSNSGCLLMIILMFIGACSGSTGGGIKVSTFTVIMVGMVAVMRGKKDITIGKRRIENSLVGQALAIFAAYLTLTVVATLIINTIEPDEVASFSAVMFEVVSALGTVGLTMALTPLLGPVSKLILTLLMYLGRVGVITFALALKRAKKSEAAVRRPVDNVFIG